MYSREVKITKYLPDCVSFKPNSTNVLIQNLDCSGSHGVSIGSIGQYPGVYDIVEDIFVSNITLRGGGIGARIKVWPDMIAGDGNLMGGGGTGPFGTARGRT